MSHIGKPLDPERERAKEELARLAGPIDLGKQRRRSPAQLFRRSVRDEDFPVAALSLFIFGGIAAAGYLAVAGVCVATMLATIFVLSLTGATFFWWFAQPQRVIRWLAQLPMPVDGYVEAMSRDESITKLGVTLDYRDEMPSREIFNGVIGQLVVQATRVAFNRYAGGWSRRAAEVESESPAHLHVNLTPFDSNFPAYDWFRDFARTVLAPLHRAYPIARVRLSIEVSQPWEVRRR